MKENELPKAYDHEVVEKKWYAHWEEQGYFEADSDSDRPPYCVILPPPNVTGVLHMGHALVDTLQDILCRWKRMSGYEVLWMPGTDHAGIATQSVVEQHLIKSEGKRRSEYSREAFLKHVWQFKEENQAHIIRQLKLVGCSLDWSRLRFTMDEKSNRAVRCVFKKMYDDGLIYRGDYLVNWDPVTETALADDEVEHEERDSSLWHFRYPIEGCDEKFVIATTRPETMLGDTAVAVSPSDERYKHLVGKQVRLPITNRLIPIIADHYVDPEFGTGVVKITPAHDFNDYEVGQRNDLEMINIMTPDGRINEAGGKYAGMTMEEARKAIVAEMRELKLLEKVEPHKNRVGISYRSKAVIEPYLSKQWFVKMTAFKGRLMEIVEKGDVALKPEYWKKTYYHWIENLRDWCISRQLWWGHRIPIWYHEDGRVICHDGEGEPQEVKENPEGWHQDEDVLDTWFSSALWPFSTLGWPEKTADLDMFYPTSVLVTGHDILFFWVARMILMGEYVMGDVPFADTFIHGLIYGKSYWRTTADGHVQYVPRDERIKYELGEKIPSDVKSKWEKMSKSKGNVIDPIEIIEKYGADAMRMALCSSTTDARQIDLDRRRFEEYKNFSNKIWNASRFVMMNLEGLSEEAMLEGINGNLLTFDDAWILSRLNHTILRVEESLTEYDFDVAANTAYSFFWDEFCSYYVEMCKPYLSLKIDRADLRQNKQIILVHVLLSVIRLMHPITPFITEELYGKLQERFPKVLLASACMVAPYPECDETLLDPSIEEQFAHLCDVLHAIRNIRGEMGLPPNSVVDVHIVASNSNPDRKLVEHHSAVLHALTRIGKMEISEKTPELKLASTAMVRDLKVLIPLPEELIAREEKRLAKEKEKLLGQISGMEGKLSNAAFVDRAPEELVKETKTRLAQAKRDLDEISSKLLSIVE